MIVRIKHSDGTIQCSSSEPGVVPQSNARAVSFTNATSQLPTPPPGMVIGFRKDGELCIRDEYGNETVGTATHDSKTTPDGLHEVILDVGADFWVGQRVSGRPPESNRDTTRPSASPLAGGTIGTYGGRIIWKGRDGTYTNLETGVSGKVLVAGDSAPEWTDPDDEEHMQRANRLADECGKLAAERDELLVENARLRRGCRGSECCAWQDSEIPMNPKTTKEARERLEHLARDAFAKHDLLESSERRWLIGRLGSSFYRTEIALLAYGRILVHGDIKPVLYGGCYEKDASGVFAWLTHDSIEYVCEKVCAGTAHDWDDEVALHWIDGRIAEETEEYSNLDEGGTIPAIVTARIDGWRKLRREVEEGVDRRMFRDGIIEITGDVETGSSAGEVPSVDVIYTREAVRTLMRLLEATTAKAVSP